MKINPNKPSSSTQVASNLSAAHKDVSQSAKKRGASAPHDLMLAALKSLSVNLSPLSGSGKVNHHQAEQIKKNFNTIKASAPALAHAIKKTASDIKSDKQKLQHALNSGNPLLIASSKANLASSIMKLMSLMIPGRQVLHNNSPVKKSPDFPGTIPSHGIPTSPIPAPSHASSAVKLTVMVAALSMHSSTTSMEDYMDQLQHQSDAMRDAVVNEIKTLYRILHTSPQRSS